MARRARVVIPGIPHHITQRGIRRSPVFHDDEDRRRYGALLLTEAERFGVSILAYCWMTNHVHIVAIPKHNNSLALVLGRAHSSYSLEFNQKHGFSGHLWQERFYSCPLDDGHMIAAIRYVERNPVRAGMKGRAEDYVWSSARAHCGLARDPLLTAHPLLERINDWSDWLAEPGDSTTESLIRNVTRTGRPCGTDSFVKDLERQLGQVLGPKRRGPKPKERTNGGFAETGT